MKYFKKIQRKNKTFHGRWDTDPRNYEIIADKPSKDEELAVNDKGTQYGEDNPDEDFFEGAKFMAIKMVDREARTHHIQLDKEDYDSFSRDCGGNCSKWPDCDEKCGKYFCRDCHRWDDARRTVIYECKCNCRKRECDCELEDSDFDPDDIDNSDSLEEFDESDITDDNDDSAELKVLKAQGSSGDTEDSDECDCKDRTYSEECDCENCDCALTKLKESSYYEIYKKYKLWESETPGDLVKELAEKIIELRGGRFVPNRYRARSVSPRVDKYGPDGVGPWG